MNRKSVGKDGRRFSDLHEAMEALDILEERLDRIADRLNALWDRAVQGQEPGETRREKPRRPKSVRPPAP